MPGIPQLLVHEHNDNVGVVVVEGLKSGTTQCTPLHRFGFHWRKMGTVL